MASKIQTRRRTYNSESKWSVIYGLRGEKKTKQITMKTYQAAIISRYLLFGVYNNEVGSTPRNHDARECE